MKKYLFIILLSLALLTMLISPSNARAQAGQIWETIVGNPLDTGNRNEDTGREGGGGGEDGLGPGEFQIAWRCWLDYRSSTYGPPEYSRPHSAWSIDVNRGSGETDRGDPILASADGTVVDWEWTHGTLTIRHEGGYYTSYTHMQNRIAKIGDRVTLGQKIGEIGNTYPDGYISPHVHINHSRNGWSEDNRIQVCYVRYGCDRNSVRIGRSGIPEKGYNKGCP
jgi:murein DD-endopeptidase MepM/ murein hydrolase activator NlpD